MECLNNLRQLGLATLAFESDRKVFPGYRETLKIKQPIDIRGIESDEVPVSWVVALMPYLERPDLDRMWRNMTAISIPDEGVVTYTFPQSPRVYLNFLICPNDPQSPQPAGSDQPLSYVANSGLPDVAATTTNPADWPENGVFVSRWELPSLEKASRVMLAQNDSFSISRGDGVAMTLLLGENIGARYYDDVIMNAGGLGSLPKPVSEQWTCFVWQPVYPLPANLSQAHMNVEPVRGFITEIAPDISCARPSSRHPGGANFVFCDGHVQFIRNQIDDLVFAQLMTPDGSRARMPGAGESVPNEFMTTSPDFTIP